MSGLGRWTVGRLSHSPPTQQIDGQTCRRWRLTPQDAGSTPATSKEGQSAFAGWPSLCVRGTRSLSLAEGLARMRTHGCVRKRDRPARNEHAGCMRVETTPATSKYPLAGYLSGGGFFSRRLDLGVPQSVRKNGNEWVGLEPTEKLLSVPITCSHLSPVLRYELFIHPITKRLSL